MTRVYAIGDIHGYLSELRRAHALIDADRKRMGGDDGVVVHLGDLTDRGPDSRGVIEFLLSGIEGGRLDRSQGQSRPAFCPVPPDRGRDGRAVACASDMGLVGNGRGHDARLIRGRGGAV